MKKTSLVAFSLLVGLFVIMSGCKKPVTPPVSERIAKAWTARIVDENQTTVYTRGGTNNVRPGYSSFKIDLSSATTASLVEFDGSKFTGQWSVPSDTRLVLSNLNPQPTGTNGTIEFTINSLTDTELKLTRTTASQKTGGTINVYTLSNP
nr:hypothetical protein [uncultured Arsenicibacter sp.]